MGETIMMAQAQFSESLFPRSDAYEIKPDLVVAEPDQPPTTDVQVIRGCKVSTRIYPPNFVVNKPLVESLALYEPTNIAVGTHAPFRIFIASASDAAAAYTAYADAMYGNAISPLLINAARELLNINADQRLIASDFLSAAVLNLRSAVTRIHAPQINGPERIAALDQDREAISWDIYLRRVDAPTDVDAISETAERIMLALSKFGPGKIDLRNLDADSVQGEHLAVILRVLYWCRDKVPGWGEALEVAKNALTKQGHDFKDALFGLI
jgi:hypothetical protein